MRHQKPLCYRYTIGQSYVILKDCSLEMRCKVKHFCSIDNTLSNFFSLFPHFFDFCPYPSHKIGPQSTLTTRPRCNKKPPTPLWEQAVDITLCQRLSWLLSYIEDLPAGVLTNLRIECLLSAGDFKFYQYKLSIFIWHITTLIKIYSAFTASFLFWTTFLNVFIPKYPQPPESINLRVIVISTLK